jgi:non-specific serine/threonine protein kinase
MKSNNDNTRSHIVLTKGTMVAHYKIIDKIGAGGMGEVFLAEDTKLNRQVALKFLPGHLIPNDDAKTRFTREAQAAAGLKHPNIVTIHEVSDYQGRPFFAMECCEGKSLHDIIKEEKLSLGKIIDLVTQVCDGLQEAHEAGIIHRDIKPSNIILDKNGRPKLVDFGLAAVQGTDKLTKTGSTLGTVGYMSPEQIRVDEADQRSDLFSLGVVLYKMITGRLPFKGDTEAAALNSVLNDVPEPLSRYKSGVSGELQRIVSKLLEKDPQLRYQSAAGIISDLKRLTVGTPAAEKPRKAWWNHYIVTGAMVVLGIMFGYWILFEEDGQQAGDSDTERKALVVLPFENLGNPNDAYFADGMTDEITARLASIRELRVTSRTSAMQYRDTDKSIKKIGKELGVDYILEGTIRWDKSGDTDRVRIIPQLIQVSDDSHIWANTFERAITQVFAVQADIATQISEALGVALLDPERQTIETEPTQNMEAYHYYLRGKQYWAPHTGGIKPAIQMIEKAVKLDTTYFQAYALLVRLYGFIHLNNLDPTDQCYQKAQDAANNALRFAEGHSDGYLAMGYFHYYLSRDYVRALEQFEKARKGQPNNSELLEAIGYVQRRQGRWNEALENQQKAYQLDPMNTGIVTELLMTLYYMHRLDDARRIIHQGFEFGLDSPGLFLWNYGLTASITGDTAEMRKALIEFERHAGHPVWIGYEYWAETADVVFRDFESAVMRRSTPGDYILADSSEFYLKKGLYYALLGQDGISYTYYDSALVICEKRAEIQPDNAYCHSDLAEAYSGLGRYQEAIEEAKTAVELLPISKDAMTGPEILSTLADVYIEAGEHELAIDLLDTLLRIPSFEQVMHIRLHPSYDPLRDNPRFGPMLEKYAKEHGLSSP